MITFELQEGEAIDLIIYDQANKKFQLNPDAMNYLFQQGSNIGFIFNLGQKKVGKSFLFNLGLDLDIRNNSFKENSKGIKLWTKPFYRDEENLNIYFIDVEGFDYDQNFKNFVWSLSFLLGTVIIYSTQGDILDQHWNDLNTLTYLVNNVQFSTNPNENEYTMSYYAPKFIWLLKDLNILERDDLGREILPEKYLEIKIKENMNNPNLNVIKAFFDNVFKDRTCLNFEPQNYQKFNFGNLSNNLSGRYKDNILDLKEKIYSRSFNKYFDGVSLSPRMAINFINCIIELFNNNQPLNYYEMFFKKIQCSFGTGM